MARRHHPVAPRNFDCYHNEIKMDSQTLDKTDSPPDRMKTPTKQQIVQESFYKVEEDHEVQELREKKEQKAREIREFRETLQRLERERMYMIGGMCIAHDKIGCPECRRYARGECPSAIEEGLPHDF